MPPLPQLQPRTRGALLASILMASILALSLWAVSYRRLSSLIQVEERVQYAEGGAKMPDEASALGRAMACLRVSPPVTTPTSCRMTIVAGPTPTIFEVTYTQVGTGTGPPAYTAYQLAIVTVPTSTMTPCPCEDQSPDPDNEKAAGPDTP